MASVVEQALARAVPQTDGRSWLTWGAATFLGVETAHVLGGLAINDWEGWGSFFGGVAFVVVSGLVIVGLVFGLLARWGLRQSPRGRNRPARAALGAGLLSVAGYAVLFTWAHLLIAPAAVLLGRAGLTQAREGRGGRRSALAGALIGTATLCVGVVLLAYAMIHGDYPLDFLG